ncbi:hypothetical protein QL093DRAFT_1260657 [Fusarium oxysporum]|nr:hypothetical protein QL093DRAFT_1260657 [Fusarium oxysporum]
MMVLEAGPRCFHIHGLLYSIARSRPHWRFILSGDLYIIMTFVRVAVPNRRRSRPRCKPLSFISFYASSTTITTLSLFVRHIHYSYPITSSKLN